MQTRPNILWFSMEDTSPRFGCYGDKLAQTPNLDRVAGEGCLYDCAFSVAGVCAPSRSAIITGMYPTFIGSHHMRTTHQNRLTPEMPTPYDCCPPHYAKCFPEYLRAAGYYCTNNSKTDYQFASPFTAWDECDGKAHWRHRREGQPFFAVFNPTGTHESGMWKERPNWHGDHAPQVTDSNDVIVPPFLPDTQDTRVAIARQYDNIVQSDGILGDRLRELEEDGLLGDTIIVIWSDHGEGLPRAKRWPYDSGTRIPLIVRWPGVVQAGTSSRQLVSLIDLGPTMLSMCGVPVPVHMQGQPFVGPAAVEREYVFATRDRHDEAYDMVRAVRDNRFKYVRNYRPDLPYQLWLPYNYQHPAQQDIWRLHLEGKLDADQQRLLQTNRPPEELYDLDVDPFEMTNLASEPKYAGDLERLRKVMDDWRRDFDPYGEMSEADMVRRWYPDGKQPKTAAPIFAPINKDCIGDEASTGGRFAGPLLLQLHSATQGASIGYTMEAGEKPRWELYTGPIRLEQGAPVMIRAKAIRIGYAESAEAAATFEVV